MKTYKNKSFYTYMLDVKPFKIDVPAGTLDAIREKVIAFPWHEMPDDGGWEYGTV